MSAYARPSRRHAAAAIALAGFAAGASAETPQDHWWGELEYFYPTISSKARLDFPGTNVQGTEIRLEDDLGLADRKGTPYFLLGTRIGQPWRVEFEYYYLNRTGTHVIDKEINWGDQTYPVNATVSTKFDTNIYRLVGGYSFYRTSMAEAGGSLGLHVTDFRLGLSGTSTSGTFQSETKNALAPLPTLGVYGVYKFNDQMMMRGRIDYLSLTVDKYHGQLVNTMAGFSWRFMPNWGAGVAYRYVSYNLKSTNPHFVGEIKYDFKGPTIYLEAGF
jgi:hypothetical protein